jgi:predicted  nucleic acid-binding Zn-ribbon protein
MPDINWQSLDGLAESLLKHVDTLKQIRNQHAIDAASHDDALTKYQGVKDGMDKLAAKVDELNRTLASEREASARTIKDQTDRNAAINENLKKETERANAAEGRIKQLESELAHISTSSVWIARQEELLKKTEADEAARKADFDAAAARTEEQRKRLASVKLQSADQQQPSHE